MINYKVLFKYDKSVQHKLVGLIGCFINPEMTIFMDFNRKLASIVTDEVNKYLYLYRIKER
jgi:hypothetical protein